MEISTIDSITRLTELIFMKHSEQCPVHISAIEVFVEYINKIETQTQGFRLETLVCHAAFVVCPNH